REAHEAGVCKGGGIIHVGFPHAAAGMEHEYCGCRGGNRRYEKSPRQLVAAADRDLHLLRLCRMQRRWTESADNSCQDKEQAG
ncbi:MAG: hypothetical protein HYS67_04310, partial [Deltaproteobacteria bacterium]|nr:hypothetical protein [Deltaproteobacteria bacterium]